MQRRSRKGCIDCKKAKVKCDEEQPTCGTCKRRGYACQGYAAPVPSAIKHNYTPKPATTSPSLTAVSKSQRSKVDPQTPALIPQQQWYERRQTPKTPDTRDQHETLREEDEPLSTPQNQVTEVDERDLEDSDVFPSDLEYTEQQITTIARARANSMQLPSCPPLYPTVPDLPPDAIGRTDQPGVEIYFSRHPSELVISKEFVNEMNANVLQVFNQDPPAVAETLSAIGHIYLGEGGSSIVPVLDRKQRILARLRDRRDLEQMMIMLLGLCALEVRFPHPLSPPSLLPITPHMIMITGAKVEEIVNRHAVRTCRYLPPSHNLQRRHNHQAPARQRALLLLGSEILHPGAGSARHDDQPNLRSTSAYSEFCLAV